MEHWAFACSKTTANVSIDRYETEGETGFELAQSFLWGARGHHLRFGTSGNATFEPGYKVSEKAYVVHNFAILKS